MPLTVPSTVIDPANVRAIFAPGQWGYYCGDTGNALDGSGFFHGLNESDAASSLTEDETGIFLRQSSGGAVATARIRGDANIIRLDQLPLYTSKWRLENVADIRFICVLLEIGVGNVSADDIGSNAIGIQFSTDRGDTNFQFVVNDGTVQNLVDSGIAADTNPHFMQINATAADNVTVSLLDNNFEVEASTIFTTVNPVLPVTSVDMNLYCGFQNLVGASKNIDQYYGTAILRNS